MITLTAEQAQQIEEALADIVRVYKFDTGTPVGALATIRAARAQEQIDESWCIEPKPVNGLLSAEQAEQRSDSERVEPVAWFDECRITLVTEIHMLSSDFENSLYAFRDDLEARKHAEGSIAFARSRADKWNWNGCAAPVEPVKQEPVAFEMICPRCKVDRVTTQCPNRGNLGDCPMTATAQNAAPVRTKDLTDDEIDKLIEHAWNYQLPLPEFARAVIAKDREKNRA